MPSSQLVGVMEYLCMGSGAWNGSDQAACPSRKAKDSRSFLIVRQSEAVAIGSRCLEINRKGSKEIAVSHFS